MYVYMKHIAVKCIRRRMDKKYYLILFGFLMVVYFYIGSLDLMKASYQPVQVHLVSRHLHSFKRITNVKRDINAELENIDDNDKTDEFVQNVNNNRMHDIYENEFLSREEAGQDYNHEGYVGSAADETIIHETDESMNEYDYDEIKEFIGNTDGRSPNTIRKVVPEKFEGFYILHDVCVVPPSDPFKTVQGYGDSSYTDKCRRSAKDLIAFNQNANTTMTFSSTLPNVTYRTLGIPENFTFISDLVYMVRARFVVS